MFLFLVKIIYYYKNQISAIVTCALANDLASILFALAKKSHLDLMGLEIFIIGLEIFVIGLDSFKAPMKLESWSLDAYGFPNLLCLKNSTVLFLLTSNFARYLLTLVSPSFIKMLGRDNLPGVAGFL